MKLAHFDSSAATNPAPVIGWLLTRDDRDPGGLVYSNLPAQSDLAEVPESVWDDADGRVHGAYGVDKTKNPPAVVVMPPPSAAEQLAAAKAERLAELTGSCQAAIVGGCSSSALGAPHTYPTTPTDQLNMGGSVTASLLPNLPADWTTPFWCADVGGAWALRPHTVAQIQQAGSDIKAWIVEQQQKLMTLSAAVAGSTTPAAVAAVTW